MAALAFHPLDPRSARQRLVLALVLAAIAWLVVPGDPSAAMRTLIAWDVAALVLLALAMWIILRADSDETRRRAAAEDPGRTLVWLVVLVASAVSVFGAAGVVHEGASSDRALGLSLATVALSWLLTHTVFTLRYAHLYYRGGPDDEGGIELPGKEDPDDLDFAYFAFTIGMCFQVSDATVSDRKIRRTVLGHAMLSFVYNTIIVALVLNLVVGSIH